MKRTAIFLLATLAALSGWAQGTQGDAKVVGKLSAVQGLVTVGSGDRLGNAVNGGPLVVGNRIIATAGGGATLVYDNGCHIALKANEAFTVKEDCDCEFLQASVRDAVTGAVVAKAAAPKQGDPKIAGKLLGVEGLVTEMAVDRSFSVASGMPLIVDDRIITSSSGRVTLAYDNGCYINLKPNEMFTVKRNSSCCALVAAVQGAGATPALAAAGGSVPALIYGTGVALILLNSSNHNTAVSPN